MTDKGYYSSSLSSSIATSESLSSSPSSSRVRFVPRLSGVPASFITWSAPPGALTGAPEAAFGAEPGRGALKMLCWRSVTSTFAAEVGSWKVPSSSASLRDLDLA